MKLEYSKGGTYSYGTAHERVFIHFFGHHFEELFPLFKVIHIASNR